MSGFSSLLLCAIFLVRTATVNGASVFAFKGDPFKEAGPLNVSQLHLNKGLDGLPSHTHRKLPATEWGGTQAISGGHGHASEFSTEFPPCCFKGITYHHFYSELVCPRLLMNVTGYGHCSIVDETEWDVCHIVGICKTDKTNNRDLYREEFVPGVLASFFGTYLQGNSDIIKYLTTPDDMPVPLGELKYDLNC